ncbi:MAG: peptide-methionine (S)-S-oxide reductase MsrA [Bdellovibrionales bacterium]|nr:peptide-methionine (S)-S-oxide reductase MsrA [Bdellovibrionales bacterium]
MKLNYVIVAGGCFWGLEDLLKNLDGVTSTKVGYSGGDFDDPTYADIRTGKTGHAEAVRVEYDEDEISLEEILHYFFKIHDPTTKNRQGNDVGTSYRSAVFYRDDAQKVIIENVIGEVDEIGRFDNPVVTTVALEKEFYDAEEYHQNYLKKNPHGYTCHFERD